MTVMDRLQLESVLAEQIYRENPAITLDDLKRKTAEKLAEWRKRERERQRAV